MKLNWRNSRGHYSDVPQRDREVFFSKLIGIADSDCANHGTPHVFNYKHAHYAIYPIGNKYWELVFVCDKDADKVFIYRCEYCTKADAQKVLMGDLRHIESRTDHLKRLVA